MNEQEKNVDESMRLEFAKAFGWYKKKGMYDSGFTDDPRLPSWGEILVETGKILAARDFRDIEGNVSELDVRIGDIENRIRKNINPNF